MPGGGRRTPLLYAARVRPMTSSPKPVLFRGIFLFSSDRWTFCPGFFIIQAAENGRCFCANCHRMIHRDRKHPLTVEELREMYRE